MSNFIYPNIRVNPEYKFDEVLSGYNYNFTLLENVVPSSSTTFNNLTVTGNTTLNELTASTIYSGSTNLYDIFSINNFYTTGVSITNDIIHFDRNDSLSAYSVSLSAYSFNRATDVLEDYSGVQDTYLVERKGVMDANDLIWSSTIVEDFDITDVGGDLIINYSGTGKMMLRESPTEDSPLRVYSVSSSLNTNVLPNNQLSYIYVDRNSGSPIISHTINIEDFNCMDKCLIYLVTRYDSTNYAHLYVGKQGVDANRKYRRKLYKREFIERVNGLILNSISLYPTLTAGDMWFGYEEFSTVDFDAAGGSNTFTYAYYNGTSWVRNIGQSTLNNTVYNNSGTLTTMTNNRYKVEYVYLIPNKPDLLYVIYGDSEYTKIDDAEGSQPPTNLPPEVTGMGVLVGRYIILKNSTSIITESAFDKFFRPSGVIEHNNTGNLNTGDYLHLTGDEYNEFLNIKNSYLPLTGGTLSGSISATTYYGDGSNLTGINSDNFYTTGVTLSGNSLVFDRTDSLSAYSVDLSSFSPDLSGYIPYTGATGFSQTMSSTTYDNLVVDSNGNVSTNNLFDISINFIDIETWNYRAPEDFKIYNIVNPDGLNLTIDVNSSGYTTGDTIVYLDTLEITPDAAGFIKLNCEKL